MKRRPLAGDSGSFFQLEILQGWGGLRSRRSRHRQAARWHRRWRSYGESAAGTTSEWVTKNAADVEQQLLRFDVSRMVSSVKISASPSLPAPNADLPAGTIKKAR
jgi:hypothetical protein